MGKRNTPLDPRQRKFIELYLESGNQTQSYVAAGYTSNARSASVQASRLLAKPSIRDEVARRTAELTVRYGLGPERILREIATIAAVPIERVELKGGDKLKSLELLAKLQKMFPGDRVEISGPGGGPIEHVVNANHKIDIASLDPDARQKLKEALLALKAKQIEHEPQG